MKHGSHLDPPNRFDRAHHEPDFEHLEWDDGYRAGPVERAVEYLADTSRSIVSENDSPDIPFRYSVNPYRGCVHGCSYCYARNTHEYLGFNAGLDFETRIVVKQDAPALLRDFLARPEWVPELIAFSGVTDCYQPAERQFRLTRQCLEVVRSCSQPVSIVTKNALVVRDLDLLAPMGQAGLVQVAISITTLDPALARDMEPRTSTPAARLRAISELAAADVPVCVLVAPIIPGLNDHELPVILKAAKEAGALDARFTLLRLPLTVEPIFFEWLRRCRPLAQDKVEGRIRQTRGGKLNQSQFGQRMKGSGEIADQIRTLFDLFRERLGFRSLSPLDFSQFRPPADSSGQMRLF